MTTFSMIEAVIFAMWFKNSEDEGARRRLWLTQVIAIVGLLTSFTWFLMNGQALEWWVLQGSPADASKNKGAK